MFGSAQADRETGTLLMILWIISIATLALLVKTYNWIRDYNKFKKVLKNGK